MPCFLLSLFVLALLAPLASGQLNPSIAPTETGPDGELILIDAVGDPTPYGAASVSTPAQEMAYSQIDIERLVVGPEEADRLHMRLDMASRQDAAAVTEATALQDVNCYISWSYGDQNMTMTLAWAESNLLSTPGETPGPFRSELSYVDYGDIYGRGDWEDGIEISYDVEEDAFDIVLRKDRIPVLPFVRPPIDGDVMDRLRASCTTDAALYGQMGDSVSNLESTFRFKDIGQGEVLNVRFLGDEDLSASRADTTERFEPEPSDTGTLTITPGVQSTIPVRFENHADGQRIVIPSAQILDPEASGWNLTLPETLLLRSKEVRTVNLFVTPPADSPLGSELRLEVSGAFTGGPMEGHSVRTLVAEPRLDAGTNTYRFHTDAPADGRDPLFAPVQLAANLIEDDPRYTDGPLLLKPGLGYYFTTPMSPFGTPVSIDPDGLVTGQVALTADHATTIDAKLYIQHDELGAIASWQGAVSTGSPMTFEVPVRLDDADSVLPVGTTLSARLEFQDQTLSQTQPSLGYGFDPSQSFFTLPAVAIEQKTVVTDGRFQPNLHIAEGEEPFVYINPGQEYAFDLNLSNDGQRRDDLTVQTEAEEDGGAAWTVDVLPGRSYRLQPGNGTPVAVRVIAPEEAAEGTKLVLNVTAVSKHDDVARSTVQLTLVTTQVQVEGKEYEEKEGQISALADEAKESPAPAVSLLVLLSVLAMARARWRRA